MIMIIMLILCSCANTQYTVKAIVIEVTTKTITLIDQYNNKWITNNNNLTVNDEVILTIEANTNLFDANKDKIKEIKIINKK